MFVHLVFIKLTDPNNASEASRRLMAMAGKVPTLRHIEVGIDEIHSGRSWDMALTTHFDDRAGYDAYAVDPVHQGVLAWLKTVVSASATVDYQR